MKHFVIAPDHSTEQLQNNYKTTRFVLYLFCKLSQLVQFIVSDFGQ